MATVAKRSLGPAKAKKLPPLVNGERLDQPTFHERYEAMPESVRAELIGGVVYMPSPLKVPHGTSSSDLIMWLGVYRTWTLGLTNADNTTCIMGPQSEPQPDAFLCILPEYGGQTQVNAKEYLVGAPELIAQVPDSTESLDLNARKSDYWEAGVREYLVAAKRRSQVFWFGRRQGQFQAMRPGADGIFRSRMFPGLWLDPVALFKRDSARLLKVLQQGLASPEHAAFVEKRRLAAAQSVKKGQTASD